ncbi:patatin [Longimonas halophila]|uniref:Patatin n=1 Tax=Longimonas halophila TaxID=1469170 RepID=A0A2H3NID1_9BACT|nr:patatin-like phospholipase family protein [Longimonas halophila]PEN05194.1 patatin [Longimonas halophila]
MATTSSSVGLACAGGVVEGAIYEVGALCALDEAIDGLDLHALDTYVGVSSGALISSFLANGVSARTLSRAIVSESDADPRLNVQPEVLFSPALREYAERMLRVPGALWRTFRYFATHPTDLSVVGLLSTFGSVVPTGLFENTPLHRFLAQALTPPDRTNDFRELQAKLRVVTMHLDSSEIAVFGEPGRDHVPISKAVQASTALPGLYCPVEIDGEYYIDGVARRTVHASVALDEGTDLLFCINPIVPVNVQLKRHANRLLNEHGLIDHGLPAVLSQTFRAIVDSRKTTGFKKYAHTHPDADLILIEPEYDDTRMFFSNIFSFKNRHDVCEHAYQATRRHLRTQAPALQATLRRHGLRLRLDVLTDTRRTLFPEQKPSRSSAQSVLDETDQVLDRLDLVLEQLRLQQAVS